MKQDTLIRRHLSERASKNNLDRYITVSFTNTDDGKPLYRRSVSSVAGLVRMYARTLSVEAYGRSRSGSQPGKKWIPFLAFPECRAKDKEEIHLHFHILSRFPNEKAEYLENVTRTFWNKRHLTYLKKADLAQHQKFGCFYNTNYIAPSIDIRRIDNPYAVCCYNLKNIEQDFTIENSLDFGLQF